MALRWVVDSCTSKAMRRPPTVARARQCVLPGRFLHDVADLPVLRRALAQPALHAPVQPALRGAVVLASVDLLLAQAAGRDGRAVAVLVAVLEKNFGWVGERQRWSTTLQIEEQ